MRYIVVAAVAFILVGVGAGLRSSEKCKSCSPGARIAIKPPSANVMLGRDLEIRWLPEFLKKTRVKKGAGNLSVLQQIEDAPTMADVKKEFKIKKVLTPAELNLKKRPLRKDALLKGGFGYLSEKDYYAEIASYIKAKKMMEEYKKKIREAMRKGKMDDARRLKNELHLKYLEIREKVFKEAGASDEKLVEIQKAKEDYKKFLKKIEKLEK